MTLTPERIADMREALDADPDLDSVTSRRTTFLALLDAADKLARLTALLDELRPLEAKATPGPWAEVVLAQATTRSGRRMEHRDQYGVMAAIPGFDGAAPNHLGGGFMREDSELIAAARNALAEMLRVVGS